MSQAAGESDPRDSAQDESRGTMLKALMRERSWAGYRAFKQHYERHAKRLDASLVGSCPGDRTYKRWLRGETGEPQAEHRIVLESMFPGWSTAELFAPYRAVEDDRPTVVLKDLCRRQGVVTHRAFTRVYDEAARQVDGVLVGLVPRNASSTGGSPVMWQCRRVWVSVGCSI